MTDKYSGYEVYNIPAASESATEWKYVVDDWMIVVDGISKTARAYNTKTRESRDYSYAEAIEVMFGSRSSKTIDS